MRYIFHSQSCSTNQRILKEWRPIPESANILFYDIRQTPLTAEIVDEMRRVAGSYEALFSRVARLYRLRGLHLETLGEADFKRLILEEYTFLKRPILLLDDRIFIGNAPTVVLAAKEALMNLGV